MKKRQIAHFFADDKFFGNAICLFDTLDNYQSVYYTISDRSEFVFLDTNKIVVIHPDEVLTKVTDSSFCDILILHSLYTIPLEIIGRINPAISVVWFSWGFDIYNNTYPKYPLIKLRNQYIEPQRKITEKIKQTMSLLRLKLWRIRNYWLGEGRKNRKIFEKAINRVDYFSGVFPEEYDLMNKRKIFRAKRFVFNYSSANFFSENTVNDFDTPQGRDIQIGHNGTRLVNHIDVLNRLSKLSLKDRKIISPLSYQVDKHYFNQIVNRGYELFGVNFEAITTFLPIKEYEKRLSSVGYVIINAKRQIAVGNALLGIWNGSKVFFPKKSMNYLHFVDMGIKVFAIENDLNEKELSSHLTRDEIINNRRIISDYYRFERVRERLIESLKGCSIN